MVQGRVRRWTASLAVVLLGVLLSPVPGAAWPTDATALSGQAAGVRGTVLGITAVVADTGPLPESGGAREASLLNVSAGGLSAEVVHASTVGQGDGTRSEASLASDASERVPSPCPTVEAWTTSADNPPALTFRSEASRAPPDSGNGPVSATTAVIPSTVPRTPAAWPLNAVASVGHAAPGTGDSNTPSSTTAKLAVQRRTLPCTMTTPFSDCVLGRGLCFLLQYLDRHR